MRGAFHSHSKPATASLKASLWLRINRVFLHLPFQAFIIVWVFLMSGELEIILSWNVNVECQSVMACHSVQTDKLLCCQSGHQIKQIVRLINGKQEDEKKQQLFIIMPWIHQMEDAFFATLNSFTTILICMQCYSTIPIRGTKKEVIAD